MESARRTSLLATLRQPLGLILALALIVGVSGLPGCVAGTYAFKGAAVQGTAPTGLQQADLTGQDVLVVTFILLPFTTTIDLFILPVWISTGDDEFFFPLTRALVNAVLDEA